MKLIIRADASIQMGTGHIMRCLALAQALKQQGGTAVFAIATCPPSLQERLEGEGFAICSVAEPMGSVMDAQSTILQAQQLGCHWICVDGYQFGADYQRSLQMARLKVLFLDDYGHATHYSAEVVLNQNISAQAEWYQNRDRETKLMLGAMYSLLRQEFWTWRGWRRSIPEIAHKILITLGGSDPDNVTARVIEALQVVQIPRLELMVVVGGSNPHLAALQRCAERSIHAVQLLQNVTQMPVLIAQADLAIAAGGSTNWELAFLGLPSIIITLAENQTAIADQLQEQGISRSLGWHQRLQPAQIALTVYQLCQNPEKRSSMSQKGQALIDGEGCDRVVMQLMGRLIRLRKAQPHDCRRVWHWANEPSTRQASFQTQSIPWEEHVAWFQAKLEDENCDFWIAIDPNEIPVGQVRCDRLSDSTPLAPSPSAQMVQISISVDPQFRHRGYGRQIIEAATQIIFSQPAVSGISAWIKPNNFASIYIFEQAHFIKIGTEWREGQPALHYQLWRTMVHA